MISPGRLCYLFRRDLARGAAASFHAYKTLPRIDEWVWPFWGEEAHTVPVHVLTGADDWHLAAWMLASFFHASGLAWPVVIHDDGTLPAAAAQTFERLFAGARIIARAEADALMSARLRAFPFCAEFRRSHPLALKILDVSQFAAGDRFLVFDSDLLFFQPPAEIRAWADRPAEECWFNEDVAESALITTAEARDELGVKLWPRVNAGLGLICKAALDLDFCDRVLAQTSILKGHIWRVEQTLYALCASRHGKGGLLPKTYEVSLRRRAAPEAISRHYVGAVRHRFYAEGLRRLSPQLFAAVA